MLLPLRLWGQLHSNYHSTELTWYLDMFHFIKLKVPETQIFHCVQFFTIPAPENLSHHGYLTNVE